MRWAFDQHPPDDPRNEFREQHARAREMQGELLADEIIEIADDNSGDGTTDEKGNPVVDHEHIQRSKLRIDARKWLAAKLRPKVCGDKMQHTGDSSGPVTFMMDLSGETATS